MSCCVLLPNVIESKSHGRCYRTKRQIGKGQVVTRNRPFSYLLRHEFVDSKCMSCFKTSVDLMQCSKCKTSRYCSRSCQKVDFNQHRAECRHYKDIDTHKIASPVVDDIIILLRTIAMGSVKDTGDGDGDGCRVVGEGEHAVAVCGRCHMDAMCADTADEQEMTAEDLFVVRTVHKLLKAKKSELEIRHLLAQMRCNNFGIIDELLNVVGVGVYPSAALINHSCSPNCILRYVIDMHGWPVLEVVAIEDIPAGQELFHSYTDCSNPTAQRQAHINSIYRFKCDCSLCHMNIKSRLASFSSSGSGSGSSSDSSSRVDLGKGFESQAAQECAQRVALCSAPLQIKALLTRHLAGEHRAAWCSCIEQLITAVAPTADRATYESALSSARKKCEVAQTLALLESDRDAAAVRQSSQSPSIQLFRAAVAGLTEVCGPFNQELYKVRCQLLTQYLVEGDLERAFDLCQAVVCWLSVALSHLPVHPLLGLQLFTLGDLAHRLDKDCAQDLLAWTAEILQVTHGPGSHLFQQLLSLRAE